MEACEYNPPPLSQKTAENAQKFIQDNSIINLPPLFIGLAMTQYSTANLLRARILDFFKSPRPLLLAVKAFFQIFKSYSVLKFLSK